MINLDKMMNYSFTKEDKQGCHYINEKIGSELTVYEPKRTHKSNRPKLALGEMSGEKRKYRANSKMLKYVYKYSRTPAYPCKA